MYGTPHNQYGYGASDGGFGGYAGEYTGNSFGGGGYGGSGYGGGGYGGGGYGGGGYGGGGYENGGGGTMDSSYGGGAYGGGGFATYDFGQGGSTTGYDSFGDYQFIGSGSDDYENYPRYNQGTGPVYAQDVLGTHIEGQVEVTTLGKQGEEIPESLSTFELCDQVFPSMIMAQLRAAGFTQPTPIQANTWAIAIQGRDIVGISKTGSGKTLAFLIPGFMKILNYHGSNSRAIQLLTMAPTRELAKQIEAQAQKFGGPCRIKTACLYGGASRGAQLGQLKSGVQVVVATPGRLNDFLEFGQVNLSHCSYIVLDEADRMLDMGFEPQIRTILAKVPDPRQTLLYAATWAVEVRSLASDFLIDPFSVAVGHDKPVANEDVSQHVIIVKDDQEKLAELRKILETCNRGDLVLIFCDTKQNCAFLAKHLHTEYKIPCAAIHGDLSQRDRDFAIQSFTEGRKPILVGTDVAQRGLDVKGIKVVINFDPAGSGEDYVHRIGRTGRAGQKGFAYTFLTTKNSKKAKDIVNVMQEGKVPVPPELNALAGGNNRKSQGMGRGKGKSKGKGNAKGNGKGKGKGKSLLPM